MLQEAYFRSSKWDLGTYHQSVPYLASYLSSLLSSIGREERRIATARYVEGLLLPGRRKFIRPLAERLKVDPQSLQQAVTHSPWDSQQVWSAIRNKIIPLFEPLHFTILHERAWVRQGNSTVGVGNQRCGASGKKARCQISIDVLLGDGEIAAPVAGRLYLPENWAGDSQRREAADIPDDIAFSTKPALAIELLKEVVQDGVDPGIILGDPSYGNDQDFRAALTRMGVEFFLEIDAGVNMAWDFTGRTTDPYHQLQAGPFSLANIIQSIDSSEWKQCSWIGQDGIQRQTRLVVREMFLDSMFRVPGELQRLWVIVDWPVDLPQPFRCFLAHFHTRPSVIRCLRLSRHHSGLELYRRYVDNDLDLTCYQGRSWRGFHHHLVLAAAAYLFVLAAGLRARRAFWPQISDDTPVDSALSSEVTRLASTLFRYGTRSLSSVPSIDGRKQERQFG